MIARTTLTRASLAALVMSSMFMCVLPPSLSIKNKTTSTACSLILGFVLWNLIYEALLRITRPLVLVFVPGVFQVVEDPDLPFRLPRAANAPNPSLGDAVLPGEFLVIVAGELLLDAGVADGAGEALGLRDIDRSASDDLGQLVEVIRPDCLGRSSDRDLRKSCPVSSPLRAHPCPAPSFPVTFCR